MLSKLFVILIIVGLYQASKRLKRIGLNSTNTEKPAGPQSIARDQALEILDLKDPFTKQEVQAAHKRLMNRVHPDKGGNDYFSSQLNGAKSVLLQELEQG